MGTQAVDPRAAWEVVERFERAIAEYCGAPYAISTDSCTNALYLCFVRAHGGGLPVMNLPTRTYVGVPRAAMRAGWKVRFENMPWEGEYGIQVPGHFIVDSARLLTRDVYCPFEWRCLSFHFTKHLPIGRGGAILCDDEDDAEWFRRAAYDGRDREKSIMDQTEFQWGCHAYMPPESAARGLLLMSNLKDENEPLPGEYPNLAEVRFL